jgi:hypothetical protein
MITYSWLWRYLIIPNVLVIGNIESAIFQIIIFTVTFTELVAYLDVLLRDLGHEVEVVFIFSINGYPC